MSRKELVPLSALIAACLLIGIFTLQNYGESWDENNYLSHARYSLQAYAGNPPEWDPIYRFYGPSSMMVVVLIGKLFPKVILSDIAHALSFLSFLAGFPILYNLARRWLEPWEAYAAVFLFASQPLLWGHAFINSKDTPFMIGFMASIYFALKALDEIPLIAAQSSENANKISTQEWRNLTLTRRIFLPLSLILSIWLSLWLTKFTSNWRFENFPLIISAPEFSDLEQYLYGVTQQFGYALTLTSLLLLSICALTLIFFPSSTRHIFQTEIAPILKQSRMIFSNSAFIAAAIIIGFTAAIRFFGLAALVLIAVAYFYKHKRAALLPIALLSTLSGMVMFTLWPYLWHAPIFRFLLTVAVMLRFPFPGTALFEGAYFAPEELPNYYLPKLIGIQITEPALICCALGAIILLYFFFKKQRAFYELAILSFFWLFLPVIWAVIGDSNLYDNFRQLHFILPPLFMLAGLGLHPLFQKLTSPHIRALVILLLILPGIAGYLRLFPYEYTYYNSLAGKPTFRQYESDYWATSFREASRFLNETVPLNSTVVVWGPVSTISNYLRVDIEVTGYDVEPLPDKPYYALIMSRFENDLKIHPEIPVLITLEKNGAILSVIKYIE